MPAVTFSFRFNNGHLTRLPEHQEHLHLNSVSIQLSVFIHIISVSLHAFSVVIIECVLLHFACYCIFIRFSILKSVASYSYVELTDNNIRFAEYKERSRARSRRQS